MINEFQKHCLNYTNKLNAAIIQIDTDVLEELAQDMLDIWRAGRQVFICGNGGSAANAMHIANDLFYGVGKGISAGLRVHALPANVSVLTCLANDEGYDQIYAQQLANLAGQNDLLIVLSGSGNSANIIAALNMAKAMQLKSYAILGYDGGKAKNLADRALHLSVNDMQISEDMQTVMGHIIMQWLFLQGKN